jgi:uncharacterized protein YjbI with pentapeptide repeats
VARLVPLACERNARTEPILDPKELLERYARGERKFGRADLRGADLSGGNLDGANLVAAEFRRADLTGADLTGACLSEADLSGADLSGADLSGADLTGAKLRGANLWCAKLRAANLWCATLSGANLSDANLSDANLWGATFDRATLSGAVLACADLSGADLSRAYLRRANLRGANLSGANLAFADFHHAALGDTVLAQIDLGPIVRATIEHSGPSWIDWSAVVKSVNEPSLKDFLRRAGMPDVFVEYMVDCARCLDPSMVFSLLQSTFISYGGPDEAFARKLNEALEQRGVTTFFFKDDAPPGERLHRVMRKGVNEHDRTILICSEASLQRPGLLNELEETLTREARDGGKTYLIPVRLDDFVLKSWAPATSDLAQRVRERVISDFRMHEVEAEFDAEVAKLIAVLKKPVAQP